MTAPTRFRSIFVSDTHLGSRKALAEPLLQFLERSHSEFLYLVGDIADVWDRSETSRWPATHTAVLELVRDRARSGTHVHYLPGNHDRGLDHWMSREVQARVSREHEHRSADGRRLLVLHGDHFDRVVSGWTWLSRIGDTCAAAIDRIGSLFAQLLPSSPAPGGATRVKQLCKRVLGYTGTFERKALADARRRDVDGVICGHIHDPACRQVDGLFYGNDGDWVQSCTALVEHEDGRFELLECRPR